jgi:four helix bundle protein
LDIYKKADKLAVEIHNMSLELPKFELYEEGSQIRKSSKSVKSNITEGFGRRRYKQEFIKFLTYSIVSCDETRGHLDTLFATKSL